MADGITRQTPVTVESVKAKFDRWRSTRQGIERIPEALWNDVQVLLEHCSMSQVSQALRVSYRQIRGREPTQRGLPNKKQTSVGDHSFVEAVLPSSPQSVATSEPGRRCTIEIKTANGTTVAINHVQESTAMQWAQALIRS